MHRPYERQPAEQIARPIPGTRVPCYVFERHQDLAQRAAEIVKAVIQQRNALGQAAVLGLPAGSTPVSSRRMKSIPHQ